MSDADETDVTADLGLAHRVGEAQVRVAHHAEDVGDAPVDHGFDHDVRDGPGPGMRHRQGDVDTVIAHLGPIGGRGVIEAARRLAVLGGVVPTVPGAPQPPLLDRTLAQRSSLVRALVAETAVSRIGSCHRQRRPADGDRRHPPLREFVDVHDLVPFELAFRQCGLGRRRLLVHCHGVPSWSVGG